MTFSQHLVNSQTHVPSTTVNVEMFALYIFLSYSRLSHIHQNMYNIKISFTMPYRANIYKIKNANLYSREIDNFLKFAKIHTREHMYVHSIPPYAHIPLKNEFALGAQIDINNMKCTCPTRKSCIGDLTTYIPLEMGFVSATQHK